MTQTLSISNLLYEELVMLQDILIMADDNGFSNNLDRQGKEIFDNLYNKVINSWLIPIILWTELSSLKTRKLASLSFCDKLESVGIRATMSHGILWLTLSSASITTATSKKLNLSKLSEIIMTVHFYEGQSYSWEYSNRTYDDSGCWEDYLTPDEYEDALDRKRFEQSNRDW